MSKSPTPLPLIPRPEGPTEPASEVPTPETHAHSPSASAPARPRPERKVFFVGLDLGTNTSCLLGSPAEAEDFTVSKIFPTVVGHVREGIVNGILPGDADTLFGDEAVANKVHLDLTWPLADGVVADAEATKAYVGWLRRMIPETAPETVEIRAVVGVPANATAAARETVRRAVTGSFDRVLLVPEPFLAALGFRDDKRVGQRDYVDPVNNALFIDIGAGTTDLCLVQGYFPGPEDQISFAHGGDRIDAEIARGLAEVYPDLRLSPLQLREIKEAHSYVGPSRRPIDVRVIVQGKGREIEVADIVGDACNRLFERIHAGVQELIQRASPDSVADLMRNILITGGGSRIRGMDTRLQERLVAEGYEAPRVRTVGVDYKRFVGIGAVKAARSARDKQWQVLFQ